MDSAASLSSHCCTALPSLSLLFLRWPGHAHRIIRSRPATRDIVAATQIRTFEIEDIQFQFLFLNTRNDERRTGDLTALDAANVVASSLPRDRLALAGQVLCWAPLRENTPALSCTNIECSRVRDTPGKRELLIVELLVFARCAFSTRKGSVAEN